MYKIVKDILKSAVSKLYPIDIDDIELEVPKDNKFGDLSTPVLMLLAKKLKTNPQKIAGDVVAQLKAHTMFKGVEIAGVGFINLTLSNEFISLQLQKILLEKEDYIFSNIREDFKTSKYIQIEFVSANPTGPLHIGHGRGAAFGEALSNLLQEVGYKVEKEYYINNVGRQVKLLGQSVFARYKKIQGVQCDFPQDGYKGEYIIDIAEEIKDEYQDKFLSCNFDKVQDFFINFSYKKMLETIKKNLIDFGITIDNWQTEEELYTNKGVTKAVESLKEKDYIYEKDGAMWFKSSNFKDREDRVVIKANGEYTYFASDIAYHYKKIKKGYDEIINIWGADHHGYIPRIQAVIEALTGQKDKLKILLIQMVSLSKGGQPVQMSKRAGDFVTLKEIINEIGVDTTKFLFLTRRNDSHLNIDIEIAKSQSALNPVYYVQYANARINSLFERIKDEMGIFEIPTTFNRDLFNKEEIKIIKKLLLYPMVFRNATMAREPHIITFYLQDLASMFHSYYHKYKIISTDNEELTRTRLSLCEAIKIILRHGLKILGVSAPKKM